MTARLRVVPPPEEPEALLSRPEYEEIMRGEWVKARAKVLEANTAMARLLQVMVTPRKTVTMRELTALAMNAMELTRKISAAETHLLELRRTALHLAEQTRPEGE